MRPGTPERAAIKARLAAMAGRADRDSRGHRRPRNPHGQDRAGGDAAQARARARRLAQGRGEGSAAGDRRGGRGPARVGELAVGGSRGGVSARRRAADDDLAADAQRRDDARPVEDGVPGGDRRGVASWSTSGASTSPLPRSSIASSRSARTACGTSPTIAGSKGSSTRSRRSTSPRSAATCRRRRR